MATVNMSGRAKAGAAFGNEKVLVKGVYDFAVDGGVLNNKYVLLETDDDIVITDFWVKGITELDSAADGTTIDVGILAGDEDILLDGVAEATVAAGVIVKPTVVEGTPNVLPMPLKLAADGKLVMTVLTEALTSGKCQFVIEYMSL